MEQCQLTEVSSEGGNEISRGKLIPAMTRWKPPPRGPSVSRPPSSRRAAQPAAAGPQQKRISAARRVQPEASARRACRRGGSRDSSPGAARGYYHSLGFLLALNTKQITPATPLLRFTQRLFLI
uniref:Uncharacterized protein n=1 Tax=Rousettus aegyptiacus TaxID=9407 RepID=A0A7J8B9D9_ROUAE|nr:hypothetical protein HJG63_010015 [Rousettus aegyptiacus]